MPKSSIIPKPVTEYDLRLLRIFKAVVEHGGYAAAESTLGITRSTISIHMSNLETRMKLTLCVRGRGGFALTEAGQSVYHATLTLFESLNDFSLLVGSLEKELSGELVILCADQLDYNKQKQLAKVIQNIHDTYPNLHLVLDGDSISNIEKLLLKNKAHVGIIPCYQQVEGLTYIALSSETMFLCCGADHPLFNIDDEQISTVQLQQAKTVHPGIEIDNVGIQKLQQLTLAAKSYQFDTRKAMILSGRYIGFLPKSSIDNELANNAIRIIKADTLHYQFDLSLVFKKSPREINKIKLLKHAFDRICD